MYFIDNVIFSLQFFVEYGRINIHRLSRWIFILELLAGLVRSEATEQRLFAEGAIVSHYFGDTGSSQSKSSELLFGALHGATGRT